MRNQIKTDGGFSYLDEGEGPVLLLLHGLFGALSNFKDVIEEFSKSYRVIVPMLPIYSLPVLNTNIKNLAIYVRDFIKHKKLKDIIVLGNSLGGHVALVCSLIV